MNRPPIKEEDEATIEDLSKVHVGLFPVKLEWHLASFGESLVHFCS